MTSYQQLKQIFKRISHLSYVQRIMMWDEAVMMPEGAGRTRSHALATLNRTIAKMQMSKKIITLIEAAKNEDNLSSWDVANLKWMDKKYNKTVCIPLKLTEDSTKASMLCEQAWRKLRTQNRWQEFLPYFKKSFQLVKEIAQRRAEVLNLDQYDALIDDHAPGFNQKNIDMIFSKLKKFLPDQLKKITEKQRSDTMTVPKGHFPIEKQKMLGMEIMKALQFDFQHGRLDVSHHPFCGGGSEDVRITTRYRDNDFLSSLFAICHETGHGLYEQGLPREWVTQPVGVVDSMAMHESQSLLIEMQLCRSHSFFEFLVPLLENHFGKQEALTSENLYKNVTRVKPGLIRVEADEVTYPFHVFLRYEIEKALFKDEISIEELPKIWNDLMIQYFDISTENNYKDGVMQDVHWSAGAFGYFPAYTLGRLIAAQLFTKFSTLNPDFSNEVQEGNFQTLIHWLQKNVYSYASSLSSDELLINITGESLNPDYFINHIKNRF